LLRTKTSHRGHSLAGVAGVDGAGVWLMGFSQAMVALFSIAARACLASAGGQFHAYSGGPASGGGAARGAAVLGGVRQRGLAHPGAVLPGLHARGQALAVARAIAAHHAPELVPVD